jgi:hypothetical protein
MGITRRSVTVREIKVRKGMARLHGAPDSALCFQSGFMPVKVFKLGALFWLPELARYLVQLVVDRLPLCVLFGSRENNVRNLQRRHLTGQRSILSTAIPVPIAASRKLALPIVASMRPAPSSATLLRMPTMLFFRALISVASRRSTARTVSLVT